MDGEKSSTVVHAPRSMGVNFTVSLAPGLMLTVVDAYLPLTMAEVAVPPLCASFSASVGISTSSLRCAADEPLLVTVTSVPASL